MKSLLHRINLQNNQLCKEEHKMQITINGKQIEAKTSDTILNAALQNGIVIPHMCYDRRLKPYGGCRLCVVEIKGQKELAASCATQVRKDMVIETETSRVAEARKSIIEFLLLHHPLDCPYCDKNGECKLQEYAYKYGSTQNRFTSTRKRMPERIDAPVIERNPNRCILCGVCVSICKEHQGVGAINFIGRGFDTVISPAFEETLNCESCGQCIDACPVGALGNRLYRFKTQALFSEDLEAICPFCGCGCSMEVCVRDSIITRIKGKAGLGINDGDLCSKGRYGFKDIYSDKRIYTPMIKKGDKLVETSWDEALSAIASGLKDVINKYGTSAVGGLVSQKIGINDIATFISFMKNTIGSENIDSTVRFGFGKVMRTMQKAFSLQHYALSWDIPTQVDCILSVESDLTSSLPVWGNKLIQSKFNGAKLIVADPRDTKLAMNASHWLQIKPATGAILINAMLKVIIDNRLYQEGIVASMCGFDALEASLKDYTPENVSNIIGIDPAVIVQTTKDYVSAKKRLIALTSGILETTKGIDILYAAANLVNILSDPIETLQIPADYCNSLGVYKYLSKYCNLGKDAYQMLFGDSIKALYIVGEDPVANLHGSLQIKENIKKMDFVVVQDSAVTETAKMANVLLPACSWGEVNEIFMSSTGICQKSPKAVSPKSSVMANSEIIQKVASLLIPDKEFVGLDDGDDVCCKVNDTDYSKRCFIEASPTINTPDVCTDEYPLMLITANIQQSSGSHAKLYQKLGTVFPYSYVEISSADASKYGLKDEAFVKVASPIASVYLKVMIDDTLPEGVIFAPIYFDHATINTLVAQPTEDKASLTAVKIEMVEAKD